jgi:hypothetical protein
MAPDPRALDTLAEAWIAIGDLAKAKQTIDQALTLLPATEIEREGWPIFKQLQTRLQAIAARR